MVSSVPTASTQHDAAPTGSLPSSILSHMQCSESFIRLLGVGLPVSPPHLVGFATGAPAELPESVGHSRAFHHCPRIVLRVLQTPLTPPRRAAGLLRTSQRSSAASIRVQKLRSDSATCFAGVSRGGCSVSMRSAPVPPALDGAQQASARCIRSGDLSHGPTRRTPRRRHSSARPTIAPATSVAPAHPGSEDQGMLRWLDLLPGGRDHGPCVVEVVPWSRGGPWGHCPAVRGKIAGPRCAHHR